MMIDPLRHPTRGHGIIQLEQSGERTVVVRALASSPLKFLTPRNSGRAAWVFTTTFGGGFVSGDRIAIDLRVGRGATGLFSTQSSTKVYRADRPTSQEVVARVDEGATLIMAPDATACFAGARHRQTQEVFLEPSSGLVLFDCISSGRWANKERWAFDRLESQTTVWRSDKRILYESLLLDQMHGPLEARMGRFNAVAMLVVIGAPLQSLAEDLLREVGARPIDSGDVVIVASPLSAPSPGSPTSGALVRIAATTTEAVTNAAITRLRPLVSLLGDDPWARKR
ncbi:MAG: urease accessory protein UreD [Polyangiaceae bacterium]|nr:urease accessory protein UreD [Polyangiaceae bacterium]